MAREVDDSENDPATVDLQSDDTCPLSKSSRNATFLRTGNFENNNIKVEKNMNH